MNTALRLLVFIPAAAFMTIVGLLGLGFGGITPLSIFGATIIIGLPMALIAWTISDHRKRRRASSASGVTG